MRFNEYLNNLRMSETSGGREGATFDSPNIGGSETIVATREAGQNGYEIQRQSLYEGSGFRPAGRARWSTYEQDYREAERLFTRAIKGDRWAGLTLQEALTTSDFPLLFGDVLDRSVLANYQETPYTWDLYCARKVLNDFRLARIFRVDRGASVLDGPIVPNSYGASGSGPTGLEQVTEYPMRKRVVTGYTDQLYKFGCRMDFSFETLVNDDLDALKDTPALFGRAARRTEEKRATKLFATSTGPNTTFFNNTNKNLVNPTSIPGCPYTNPPFSIDALMWALTGLANQRDLDGEPISIESAVVVFGPALKVPVMNALNATELWANLEGGNTQTFGATVSPTSNFTAATSGIRMRVANWAKDFARPAINYYLPIVDTTYGSTSWYVFASPSTGRPALQQSFLRGREAPQLFMRLPNQVAIGEGRMGPGSGVMPGTMNVNPMEGDYENDAVDYKIRHFLGGTLLDPILAITSNGSGV
jgi:hypothetical protein